MYNTKTIYNVTSILFALTALVTVIRPSHDFGMTAVWLALSAVFICLGQKAKSL